MKYTNNQNYPPFVMQYMMNDEYDYDPNTISATTLLSPPRQFALQRLYPKKLEMDISQLISAKMGTAIHDSVEKIKLKNCIQEQRISTQLLGYKISGKFDILHKLPNGKYQLIDIKSTSVYAIITGDKEESYIKQLSIYKYLLHCNNYKIDDEALIWFFFTDWQKANSYKSSYPQSKMLISPITLWSLQQTEDYIKSRLQLFKSALKKVPQCSPDELWKKDTYAITKEGNIKASKILQTLPDAEYYHDNMPNKKAYKIKLRPGQPKRCDYCNCQNFCTQYKKMMDDIK